MKKLFPLLLCFFALHGSAQSFMEGFESSSLPAGWDTVNMSGPAPGTVPAWFPSSNFIAPPAAQEGSQFIAANYQAEGNNGTISSWLFTPTISLSNGDLFQFYTRTVANTVQYPDRLELRLSLNGSSINTGTTSASTGDFIYLLASINPSLTQAGYPSTWTKYTFSLGGIPAGATGRIAFRYYVTNSGPNGINGDGIGIDSVYYRPNTATGIQSAHTPRMRFYPNPSSGIVNLVFAAPSQNREIVLQNMLGEIIFTSAANSTENSIDLSALQKGLYLLSIKENNSVYTEKLTLE